MLELLQFLYVQRIQGFAVPSAPHFDSDATSLWFEQKLQASQNYLEFGSGGSTYLAAKLNKPFVCIDSDRFFLRAVKQKITTDGLFNPVTQCYLQRNIGFTREWSQPVIWASLSQSRQTKFRRYSDFPAELFQNNHTPDLILIDGRFRVACALKVIRALHAQSGWTLVVDDYVGRAEYMVITQFARLDGYVGRMAVFSAALAWTDGEIDRAIEEYEMDFR
ncbi:hypothetical protein [Deefgea rivuli]|uniref:hypothetical protein n=1 Tax=Deefgea rivuli TaxID=400948 RepID=UPI0004853C0A|nr:hypothetical protein [Deefgea rivuli]